jgi:hypothetical protein
MKMIAEMMWPMWALGVLVFSAAMIAGKKKMLRVEKKPLLKWIGFLVFVTAIRMVMYKIASYNGIEGPKGGVTLIPPLASLTTFWEDLAHGFPLLILRQLIGNTKKWAKVANWAALILTMVSFGLGHTYQSVPIAMLLSFYIPYSVGCAERNGMGTVIIGHSLYDLVTLMFVQYFL